MTNPKTTEWGEVLLLQLLKELEEHVFITSTDSVTLETEELNPKVEDLEGTIRISGEWDRGNLQEILTRLLQAYQAELAAEIENMRPEKPYPNAHNGYNEELDADEKICDSVLLKVLALIQDKK